MITNKAGPLAVEILDKDWERLAITSNLTAARTTKELGAVGEGEVTIVGNDKLIESIPISTDPTSPEARWQLWEGGTLVFAGLVDDTTRATNADGTYSFGGAQRGAELGYVFAGRRDFNGWSLEEAFKEFLRQNAGAAPFATIVSASSYDGARNHPLNAITGDINPQEQWQSEVGMPQNLVVDLGQQTDIVGARVVPGYLQTTPGGGLSRWWHKYQIYTSPDNSTWTLKASKTDEDLLSDRGRLHEFTVTARYVKLTITDAAGDVARIANFSVYRNVATVGSETTFAVPWIENDDSGNTTHLGTVERVQENGAFNGDGVVGNSGVSRIGSGGSVEHRFIGTSTSVYFTQGTEGGDASASISLDGSPVATVTLSGNTWQTKGYEVFGLTLDDHTLTVEQVSGTPQVDYFSGEYKSSWRRLRHNERLVCYAGSGNTTSHGWSYGYGDFYANGSAHVARDAGDTFSIEFVGDAIRLYGAKGPNMGEINVYVDGSLVANVDLSLGATEDEYQQELATWSNVGDFDTHTLTVTTVSPRFHFEYVEGNFAHIIYMESFHDNHMRLLSQLVEMTNTWLRFNDDGSVDLLGVVGDSSGTIIREGENEGGTIIQALVQDDYASTASAVLAIGQDQDGMPIRAFVVDRNLVAKMGMKIAKLDNTSARDAYLLTRQAWQELRDRAVPLSRYEVNYDPTEVGEDITPGETTILYAPRLYLDGTTDYRVGTITTEWSSD